MSTTGVLTIRGIVDWLLEQDRSAAASQVESHVQSTVKAIGRQQAYEQLAPGTLNKRLTRIAKAAQRLDGLIYDDDPSARSARRVIAAELGKSDFEALSKTLEDLASGRGLDDVEFAPERQPGADEYAKRVAAAARKLSALLSENSPYAGAMRRGFGSSAIEAGHARLQDLAATAEAPHVPTQVQRSAVFAPAEVARYGAKLSSGGRPPETAKLAAVWGAYLLLVELGFPLTGNCDGELCRLSAMCYEAATAEPDADLSHAVKCFLDDLRAMKVID